jgi:hypothetical protein
MVWNTVVSGERILHRSVRPSMLVAVLFLLCLAGAHRAAAKETPTLTVNPSTVTIGTGENQFFFVQVSGSSSPVPTGEVVFYNQGNQIGTAALNSSGQGGWGTAALPKGQNNLTATYSGDSNYNGVSVPVTVTVTAGTVQSYPELTASATTVYPGTPIFLSVTVEVFSPYPPPYPSGTVTFMDGTKTLGTSTLNSTGATGIQAILSGAGAHSIVANYSGDSTFWPGASPPVTVNVTSPTTPTITETADPTTATTGEAVKLTATVTPPKGQTTVPTGSVSFSVGQTMLGSADLNSEGVATFTTSALPAGADSVLAVYTGDVNYNVAFVSTPVQVNAPALPPPADFSLSLNPAAGEVAGKGTLTTQISIAPINGFAAQVSFVCSGLPAQSTCSFSPAAFTPGSQGGVTTMTITTGTGVQTTRLEKLGGFGPTVCFAALGLLGFGLRKRRRAWQSFLLAIVLAVACACSVSGCGGSGMTSPSGVYAVAITASGGQITHSATLALEVK